MPPSKKSDAEGIFQTEEINQLFECFNKDIEENPDVSDSYHTIRHTIATELYDLYKDIKLIKEFLGHCDEKTTWGYIYRSDQKRKAFKHLTADIASMNGLRGLIIQK